MLKAVAVVAVLMLVGWGAWAYHSYYTRPLVEILHLTSTYPRRSADLTANVFGWLSPDASLAQFRLNGGPWREISPRFPRNFNGGFVIEIMADELIAGRDTNTLVLNVEAPYRPDTTLTRKFGYDPSPVQLPVTVDWKDYEIDAQDGAWEKVEIDGEWRIRPKPGYEGYDRILAVTGAFPQARRVRTDAILRHSLEGAREWGFGLFPFWGGHPDDGSHWPRRGWSFVLAWYWSKPGGAGSEISFKRADERPAWVNSYRSVEVKPGVRYQILAEIFPEQDSEGRHLRYRQLFKWWAEGEQPPAEWLDMTDVEGAPLPAVEYAVGLMAYHCQVDFGPVHIEEIPPRLIAAGEDPAETAPATLRLSRDDSAGRNSS